jgi:hypothetical protein
MMTYGSNGQFSIRSKEEILQKCKESNYTDCRINTYPEYTQSSKYNLTVQSPNFIFMDLDLTNFSKYKNPMKMLNNVLKKTLENISRTFQKSTQSTQSTQSSLNNTKDSEITKEIRPTVLWTGNGYHIYLPIQAIVLDNIEPFSKDKFPNLFSSFGKYNGSSVSEVFLMFAKDYFTQGKADPQHKPKFKSCLIRFPNTFNSKCLVKGLNKEESLVKIIQEWNGYRLPIQLLTKDFRRWLVQQEINERISNKKNNFYKDKLSYSKSIRTIAWIEKLLQTPILDYRKYCLWRIFAPYLINVKKIDKDNAFENMEKWLVKCNEIQKLQFNHKIKIKEYIRYVKEYLPISKSKLKDENFDLFLIIFN